MAVTFTALTGGSSNVDQATYTTASVTLTAGRVYLVCVAANPATAPSSVQTTGGAIVFTQHDGVANGIGHHVSVWRAKAGSTVTASIAVAIASGTGCCWTVVELGGVDVSGTNGAGAIRQSRTLAQGSNATSITQSFNAPASLVAGNARFSYAAAPLNDLSLVATSGSWTHATGQAHTLPVNVGRAAWDSSPAPGDISVIWTPASSVRSSLVMLEIASATAGESVGMIPL